MATPSNIRAGNAGADVLLHRARRVFVLGLLLSAVTTSLHCGCCLLGVISETNAHRSSPQELRLHICRALRSRDAGLRYFAIRTLGKEQNLWMVRDSMARRLLVQAVTDTPMLSSAIAALALSDSAEDPAGPVHASEAAVNALIRLVKGGPALTRHCATMALCQTGPAAMRAVPDILEEFPVVKLVAYIRYSDPDPSYYGDLGIWRDECLAESTRKTDLNFPSIGDPLDAGEDAGRLVRQDWHLGDYVRVSWAKEHWTSGIEWVAPQDGVLGTSFGWEEGDPLFRLGGGRGIHPHLYDRAFEYSLHLGAYALHRITGQDLGVHKSSWQRWWDASQGKR
jgi:hypothetical protein